MTDLTKVKGIMLSIHPDLAEKIMKGEKTWEVRKFHVAHVQTFYVYATSPVCKVVGEFTTHHVIGGSPNYVWKATEAETGTLGISRFQFTKYFAGKSRGFAFHVTKKKRYSKPKSLADFGIKRAPQSWCYVYKEEK